MKFSIITPTYRRAAPLFTAVKSVFDQKYDSVEMVIVNDSPDFDYSTIEKDPWFLELVQGGKVKYVKNDQNMGVNFSRNRALDLVSMDSSFVSFLDDDDYLFPDSLVEISKYLKDKPPVSWLIADGYLGGQKFNQVKKIKEKYDCFWDIVFFKNLKGDCLHVLSRDLATSSKFATNIKNGEEWIYFVRLNAPVYKADIKAMVIGGYYKDGVTNTIKSMYLQNTFKLLFSRPRWSLKVYIYLLFRLPRAFLLYIRTKLF